MVVKKNIFNDGAAEKQDSNRQKETDDRIAKNVLNKTKVHDKGKKNLLTVAGLLAIGIILLYLAATFMSPSLASFGKTNEQKITKAAPGVIPAGVAVAAATATPIATETPVPQSNENGFAAFGNPDQNAVQTTSTPVPTVAIEEPKTELISDQWYPVTEKEGIIFHYLGMEITGEIATFKETSSNSLTIRMEDWTKLANEKKFLLGKIQYRIKGTGEIFETRVVSNDKLYIGFESWSETIGKRAKNLEAADIEWRPKFGTKDWYSK